MAICTLGIEMKIDIYNTNNQYDLLYADPPWKQMKGGKRNVRPNQGRELDYQTCTLEEIKNHISQAVALTGANSVLFLWTIDKYLIDAQYMAESLGYKLHARMIWNKTNGIPAAFTIRFGHEYLLYMYRGKLMQVAKEERGKILSVFTEKATCHSAKPQIAYEIIERLYPEARKLEMYARKEQDGWDCWGNQV